MASLMRRSRAPAMDASTRTSVWGCENKQTRIYIKDLSPHIPNTVSITIDIITIIVIYYCSLIITSTVLA